MERLQKVMAEAGIASRRNCEQMILDGHVRVNGKVVTTLPVLVDPELDQIVVSGRKLRAPQKVYFLLNKPKNVVCTQNDPAGRIRAVDLIQGVPQRVYPVGRLDADSKGLLILTNDGELTNQLTHPKFGVQKTYLAEISGALTPKDLQKLTKGFWLSEGRATMETIKILRQTTKKSLLEITLREGRNRQIRRMLAKLGHPVRDLTRIRIGPLGINGLKPGRSRKITPSELSRLRRVVHEPLAQKKHVKAKQKK